MAEKKGKKAAAAAMETGPRKARPTPRLFKQYKAEVIEKLKTDLALKSVSQVPKIEKIVINMGLGDAVGNNKVLDAAKEELTMITGQAAVLCRAKKSIANFKLRQGVPIGVRVTLRRAQMWEFMDRLIAIALPRVRDFKGVSDKAFDGRGNYTLGLKEQIIFPEIDYDRVEKVRGMNITFVTTAVNDEQAKALLEALGMPFRRREAANG